MLCTKEIASGFESFLCLRALEGSLACLAFPTAVLWADKHGHLHSDPPLLLLRCLVLFSLATIIWAPTTYYTWHIHYGNAGGDDRFIGMKWRAYAGMDFIIRLTWSSNSGLPRAVWARTGYLTSPTLRFLMIASTFLSMMRNQWDRLGKAPSTEPSRQFLPSRRQLPTSCIFQRHAIFVYLRLGLPALTFPSPPRDAQTSSC